MSEAKDPMEAAAEYWHKRYLLVDADLAALKAENERLRGKGGVLIKETICPYCYRSIAVSMDRD